MPEIKQNTVYSCVMKGADPALISYSRIDASRKEVIYKEFQGNLIHYSSGDNYAPRG